MKFTLIKLYISLFLLYPLNIGFFLSIYWKTPKIYCIEEPETIKEPYQTPDDLAKKRGFILKVLGLYKWKNIPVAKVIFYDCEKCAHQIRDERTGSRVVSSFSSVTWLNKVERILANQQVGCGMRFLTLTCTRISYSKFLILYWATPCAIFEFLVQHLFQSLTLHCALNTQVGLG